jgi:hypothetical protein
MVQKLSKSPVPLTVQSDGCAARFEGVAIYLKEPSDSTACWEVRLWARSSEGKALAALLRTGPPATTGVAGSRCIAIVGAGADEYVADARLIAGASSGTPTLYLEPRVSCAPGVHYPVEQWTNLAGVVGVVTVPAGKRVHKIGAVSTAGGTVQIGGGPPATIIPGSSITLEPAGTLQGPVTITFVGTDAYVIELRGG